jgi:hypothetical protein
MMLPKWVDPVTKSTELVIVCTTIVCAVRVPLTVKASADDAVAAVVEIVAYEAEVAFAACTAADAEIA